MTKLALPKLTTICAILTVSAATAISTEAESGKAPAPYQWYVKISVQSGTMSDPDNVIGWLPDSVPGFDSHDLQTMPPFAPPYLTLVFNHSNWGKNSGDYDTDFRFAQPQLAVETWDFQIGDQLITKTATGGTVPVKFVFTDTYQQPFIQKLESYPICITANALADNVPSRDLYVSPDHAIYFPEWKFFVEASILAVIVNDTSMYQVPTMPDIFTYYHVLCDNQEIVLAENTPTETFIDNVTMETFDNYAEYAALYPQEHFMEELDIPRARSVRPLPRAFKQNLMERAKQLFPNLATQAA